MKLLVLLFLLPVFTYGQNTEITLNDYKVRGYVGGTTLDSVDAVYAQVTLPNNHQPNYTDVIREYNFDIGRMYAKDKDVRITNKDGKPLTFAGTAGLLNFLDFNGWGLQEIYYSPYVILLRKKGH